MSSEIMTVARVPGGLGGSFMDYGRLPRAEIIRRAKEVAAHQVAMWSEVLATSETGFDVRVVRGIHRQSLLEALPTPPDCEKS